jgi:hypothetical protein
MRLTLQGFRCAKQFLSVRLPQQREIRSSCTNRGIQTQCLDSKSPVMILPQVHLRKPCYDFYFL